ncbi:MAG: hypothetical protein BZY87_01870 [SAR202 cluster bacterium Io17-Chloro-G6]|nr:MAG: hypothetical protein BZY87_01870 [SAR202 cluster bacterium Io17-Chloro-G6]
MGNLVSGRKISVIAVLLALIALAAFLNVGQFNSTAKAGEHEGFVGLWMAVDPSDGGFNKLSITYDGVGTFDVGLSETFVKTCGGGRGKLSGSGTVEGGNLVVPITIQCLKDPTNELKGDPVGPFPVTFEAVDDNVLEFQFSVLRVPYHKVSSD